MARLCGVDRYDLGEGLRRLRIAAGKSPDDVARALNVTRTAVVLWEAGEREPRATTFIGFLEATGRPFRWDPSPGKGNNP